jgi:hypothetical protein
MTDPRIEILVGWLEKQTLDSSLTDGRIWQEMAVSERTFYRLKPKAILLQQQRAEIRQKEVEQANIDSAKEAAEKGLKSKNERVLNLQRQVDGIQQDLDAGILVDYVVIAGKVQKVNKEMNAETKAYLRKTIKDIQAEISKIEGDYAPEKRLNYNTDLAQLSDEELEKELHKYGLK